MNLFAALMDFVDDQNNYVLYAITICIGLLVVIFKLSLSLVRKICTKADDSTDNIPLEDGSVLLARFTEGLLLQQLSDGQVDGLRYNLMITARPRIAYGNINALPGALLIRIELPFHTEAHILGLSRSEEGELLMFTRFMAEYSMESVRLEGDFSQYFSVYAKRGQQTQTRYVLDPEAMQFMADHCAYFHWEIVGDELYFVSVAGQGEQKNDVVVISEAKQFVDQIRPALISHLPGHGLPGRAPYGEHRGAPMVCPICKTPMITEKHWYSCPKQHGRLIDGQQLFAIKQGLIPAGTEQSIVEKRTAPLLCPSCHNEMARTDYVSSGIIIDSCTVCSYRWCDAGELSKIAM